jgi:3-hydroxyacyl-[acyl-carrier-protein] dehydratase
MLGRMMADDTQSPGKSIDINRIMKLLPHRYPFLLIDKMVDIHGEESGTAIKNVTINEPFFQGHFPARPVMPGVLLVEAMAQAAGAIVLENLGDGDAGKLVFFMSIDKCRFRKPVGPGDQVHFHVKLLQKRAPVWKYWAEAHVDGKKVAEAEIGAMLIDERPA